MGLDISNGLFGNFHLSWVGAGWFGDWCLESQLPSPFIGWDGCNDGDQCKLGMDKEHILLAIEWCGALEKKFPEIANLGKSLLENPPDLYLYLYPHRKSGELDSAISEEEWGWRAVAAWYAILRRGVETGDTIEYW